MHLTKAFNSDIFPQWFCCAKKSLAQQNHRYKMPVNAGVSCIKRKTEMPLKLEIKSIISPDLDHGKAPDEPDNCAVFIEVEIGESAKEGAEIFSFTAITPKYLDDNPITTWGRGYLLMESFSWAEAESMLNKLLSFVREETWESVAQNLCKELHWEYENYQP